VYRDEPPKRLQSSILSPLLADESEDLGSQKTFAAISVLIVVLASQPLQGYAVLSHEELIDIAYTTDIRPALIKRFPDATTEEIKEAHAYAYGGSVIQDLGYYPFGDHEFTDLLHYVRTGDYVAWLIRDARTLNEYAFALGALSHYAADSWGHPAVNAGVAIEYPKLRAKYGNMVTYEDDPEAHIKTEFSFDVLQVAKRRYISKQFHDFIGFEVSQALIERAFQDCYGLPLKKIMELDDLAIGTFRFSISHVIPEMTQVALATKEVNVHREKHDKARSEFLYHLSRADYERDFGAEYRKPGCFARFLAFVLKLIPKFGPFKALAYKTPTAQTEDNYFRSMDNVVADYHKLIQQTEAGDLSFATRNLDTGKLTRPGDYKLADETYAKLVRQLADDRFAHLTDAVKRDLLAYFASGAAKDSLKPKDWEKTEKALAELKVAPTVPPTENTDKTTSGDQKSQ
jgi:hypothetical protein